MSIISFNKNFINLKLKLHTKSRGRAFKIENNVNVEFKINRYFS